MKPIREAIRALWATLRASPRSTILGSLLALAALVLLMYLGRQIQQISDVALPTGGGLANDLEQPTVAADDQHGVLVLNSYHRGYSWSDHELDGIAEAFENAPTRPRLVFEYLDCKHFPKMEHFDRLRELFLVKYRGQGFAVVIAADNPALEFALKYRAELFPSAAIVFCGINGYSPSMIAGQSNITGVAELLDADRTLEVALRLHPNTRHITIVHDYTITGLATRAETERQLQPFLGRITFDFLPDLTTAELTEHLRDLPPDHLVLALSYSRDKDGHVINHERIARLLSESSPVPVYGLHEERLGYGIIGGSLLGGTMHGWRAAQVALQILGGMPASQLPVDVETESRLMFDYTQLERFGIPLAALPQGAVVVNRPVSFVTEHPDVVGSAVGIFAILLTGIIVLVINMQHRRLAEERQHRLQAQLVQSQKMEAIGQLAGGVAHDFNNILTAILGYADLLTKILPAGHEGRPLAQEVVVASQRGAKLTQGLLTFSRKQAVDLKPVDVGEMVRGFEKMARRLIGEDVALETRLENAPLTIMGDVLQLEQVLLNLCANARDAMPHGGRIVIETTRLQVDESFRKANLLERTGPHAVLAVSDTGIGMDATTRRQIFEPFFTTKDVGKGTGLGLSIVYGIVKQHRGAVHCYSEPGRGSTFKVMLPLDAGTVPAALHPTPDAVRGGSETILLVEDEEAVRSMIAIVLKNAGYKVIEAADGIDAVEQFDRHRDAIHLLLCDVIMPRQNGQQAYAAIRAKVPTVRALFMSGYTPEIVRSRGLAEGGTPMVAKPVMPDQLLHRIREVLDRSPTV